MEEEEKGIRLVDLIVLLVSIVIVITVIVSKNVGNSELLVAKTENKLALAYPDVTNRYYYNQLNDTAKTMYNTLLINIDKLKNGSEKIYIDVEDENASEYFQSAWDAFVVDRPEYFYIATKNIAFYTETRSNIITSVMGESKVSYYVAPMEGTKYFSDNWQSEENVDKAIAQVELVANEIINEAQRQESRYEQIKYVHDWLVDNVEYNEENTNKNNIYGALVEKGCVCEGYAKSLKYILDKMSIPCITVYGNAENSNGEMEYHSWNYVRMEDEKWYAIDTTWDDPIIIGDGTLSRGMRYRYFMVGSNEMNKNHYLSSDISGTGQNFTYPELSIRQY